MKSVGIVQNLDGKFYALEANGNIKVLEIGDTISQGDKIFGDSTNMYTNTVNILFNDGHTLTIAGVDNAVFDTSTNESSFGNEEMAFVPKNLWTNGNTEENISDDVVADSENKNDITEEETAAGEESPTSTDNGVFSFAQRDGASVDTQSELRENQLDTTNSYDLLESVESNNITNQENIILDTIAPSFATFSITDDAGNTTGTISNGTLTDDNTPTISGNTEPNSTVNIYDGTTLIGTTTSDGNGDYTFTPTTPLGDGSHNISVTVTDNAGNTLATTPITFNIDTTVLAPSNTTTTITVNDITLDNTINSTEASGNVTISGSVSGVYATGDSVKVSVNGNDYNTSVNSNGTFSVEVAGSDLVADSNSNIDVTLIATNSVGNTGTITTDKSYTVDTSVSSLSVNITDDAGNTTGTISNGTLTDDNTPTISGNTEPNSTVNIYDGTTLIGTTTSDGNGDYTFTPTTPLGDGSHTISVTVTDNAGNTLATTPITFNIDTTVLAPSNTTTTITVNDITLDNTINSTEASGNVTISGSVSGVYATGDSVKVSVNGNDYNTSVNSNGTFSVEVAGSDLVADSNSNIDVTLIATNSVGNTGTITTDKSYTVDTSVSSLSVNITDDAGNTTGTISNGTLTDDNTPTISGNTEPNSTVNIYDGTTLIGTTTSDGNGDYTFTPTTPLGDGSHNISVTVTDNAGNTLATTPITFNIDTTVLAPSNTTTTITVNDITLDNTINSTEASGNVTISGSVSGVYATGDSVKVSVNGKDYNTSVNSNGTFSVEVLGSDLVADSNSNIDVTLIATNSVGNTGTITTDKSYTVDTSVSSLSVNITDDAGNTTGTISNGTLTDDNTPTISGNTEPNSTVNIYDGTTLIGTTTSDVNGDYTFTPTTPLGDGSHTISVTVTDNAGNTLATTPITFNIDTTAPNNPIITNIIDTNGDYSNVVMHGTGEAGATITLYAQQGSTTAGNNTGSNTYIAIATAIVATNGSWSIDISNIPDVPINDNEFFYVTQTDKSGNTSVPSDSVHYWHGDWVNSNMENNDDYIMAGNGNDSVTINVNDTNDYMVIDGGNGNDTAILKGNMSDYSITTNSEGHIIVTHSSTNTDNDTNGSGDQVELRNVETIKFADGTYDVIKGTFIPTISIVTTIVTEDNAQIIGTAQDTDGTISLASYSATNGTVTLDTNGNIIYTPNNNYSGSDNITFTIIDDKGATVTQTINLTINAVADSPTANIQVQATGNSFPSLNNLVANGSFEDISGKDSKGNIVSDVNITPSGGIGRTSITGWHLINDANSNAPVMEIHHKEHASVGATNGDNYMDLGETHNTCDHDNDNTQIGQTLSGLTNGATYLLSFDYFDKAFLQEGGLNGQNSGKLEVYWGGELIATIDDNNTIWKTKTLEVVGGSGNGSNLLSFKEVGEGGDNWGIAIDNVILVEKQGLIEYNIDISAALTDNDGSEALSVLITGVPTDGILTSSLYNLTNNNDGTWSVEIPQGTHSISDDSIILLVPSNQTDFKLGIKAKATEISDPTGNTYAETTAIMPALIEVNDTMIQNGNQYIITGSSEANINITVTIGNITKTVQTDSSGKWHVNFLDTELPINKNIVATITSIDTYGNTNQITQGLILATSGLQAEYFGYKEGQDGSNLSTLNQVDNFIANKTADATFTASKIDYYMSGGDLGKGTNLQTFIGNDATTLSNDPSDTSDAIIKFNGQIILSAGTYNFKVTGDDGYRIIIDGKIVAQYDGIQSATTREHPSFNIDDDGLHNMEILYWDQAGVAKLKIEIKEEGGLYNIIDDNILKYSIDQTSNNNLEYDENSSLIDGGVGNDILALISGQNIDFSKIGNVIKNIEEIDLSANGKNELANITLQDVIEMTDDKNEIKITGTDEDKVTLSSEWKLNTTLSDTDFNVYSNDDETVKLKIQNDITDVTIG